MQDRLRLRINPKNVSVPAGYKDLYYDASGQLVEEGPDGTAHKPGGEQKPLTNSDVNAAIAANPGATKTALGLDQVNNTSDLNKPVSTATQTALNGKVGTTGNETVAGNKTLSGDTKVAAFTETLVDNATVTTTKTLSLTAGTLQKVRLTASTACTFTMPAVAVGKSFTLLVEQAAATGNGTATFTGVDWGDAGAPVITAAAGKMDILSFVASATKWFGTRVGGFTY